MEVSLARKSEQLYEGINSRGQSIVLAGEGQAVGPMEAVLLAGASCASIDLEMILKKMQQPLSGLEVKIVGDRADDQVPKVFVKVHLHFILYGAIEPAKAERAISLSVEKYCSVLTMVAKTATIDYSFEIKEN
ncbi:MAG: OsmC family protein [Saprospiraceae bacterium]|jgi:putative redox protein|nr:OsmC family protein [Saprospiraceae bacterium]